MRMKRLSGLGAWIVAVALAATAVWAQDNVPVDSSIVAADTVGGA